MINIRKQFNSSLWSEWDLNLRSARFMSVENLCLSEYSIAQRLAMHYNVFQTSCQLVCILF